MNKYYVAIDQLEKTGEAIFTCFGNSMTPILKNKETLKFKKFNEYDIGDIVFCKVRGRFIDAHKIIKKDQNKGYLIANNHGHENGWTKIIYGKMVEVL